METSFENCLLRFAEPRGPDASPSGGPQRSQAHCGHSRASDPLKQCSVHRSKLPSSALSLPFCEIRPRCAFPRAGAFGHSDWAASTPIRGRRSLAESRYSLSAYSSSPLAANCATQRVAQELSLTHRPNSVGFGLRALGVGQRPSAQARRLCEPQKHDQQLSPTHSPLLGPARRENRIRFSRLKNKHSPKLAPVLRPVSVSLRLRCRSATFSRALGNLVKTRKRVSTISLLKRRRAEGF